MLCEPRAMFRHLCKCGNEFLVEVEAKTTGWFTKRTVWPVGVNEPCPRCKRLHVFWVEYNPDTGPEPVNITLIN